MKLIDDPRPSWNGRRLLVNQAVPIDQSKVRLLFLIRSLDHGGAQRQLVTLVNGLDKNRFTVSVITFYDGGALRPEIEAIPGVQVFSLKKRGRWDWLRCVCRFDRAIRTLQPHIVHGYMGAANELALLAKSRTGARIVWGLRSSHTDFSRYDWAYRWSYRFGAWVSRFADLIIVNSYAGKADNIAEGYARQRMLVIQNGIDIQRFRPDTASRYRTRREWNLADNESLVGLVARLDPMKDHSTFLRAAQLLCQPQNRVRFVCIGTGPEAYQRELQVLAESLGLRNRLRWIAAYDNMAAAYNAMDLAVSSSNCGEGFSNAIGEAMACGTPCVVTDIGDSAKIVGDAEQVVRPGDPLAFATACQRILSLSAGPRAKLSRASRERIGRHFSRRQLIDKTESTLLHLSQCDVLMFQEWLEHQQAIEPQRLCVESTAI
jgi:glycosyltransferase involved in cell wall biosynthesis